MVALAQQPNRHDDHNLPLDCVLCGDSLDVLSRFPDNCVDAIVCDPPAGINFMNKPFDDDRGGRDAWIAWLAAIMREALRCLKPGGHALVWALPRTSHWTAMALEDSGFEVREKLYHIFGSGFPKSMSLDKAIDKHLKAEREVVGTYDTRSVYDGNTRESSKTNGGGVGYGSMVHEKSAPITAPATPEAAQWAGWGTQTKPAVEEWILCRKPLSEKSIAENCLKWGTGGLAIDACRISHNEPLKTTERTSDKFSGVYTNAHMRTGDTLASASPQGRFPSNLLLSHSVFCVPQGTKRVRGSGWRDKNNEKPNSQLFGREKQRVSGHYADPDGYEEVEDYLCDPSCPIRLLDEQSGIRKGHKTAVCDNRSQVNGSVALHDTRSLGMRGPENSYNDQGGASRYFSCFSPDIEVPFLYCSKSSRTERNRGCEGLPEVERHTQGRDVVHWIDRHDGKGKVPVNARIQPAANDHPTVKSLSLMKWLVKLVGVPGGVILDPFCGSGSTLVACVYEGLHYIGIDQDQHYVNIAEARIAHAVQEVR